MRRMIAASALTWAALGLATTAATAQSSGLGGGGLSSSGLGSGGLGSSGLGSGLSSSGFGGSSGFGSSSGFGMSGTGFGTGAATGGNAITGGAASGIGGRGAARVGSTSFEGAYFINPFTLGLVGTNGTVSTTTGNFGSPLYTLPTLTTGTASISSQSMTANNYGLGVGIRRLPAYATTLKFAVPPPPPPAQVRFDLQNLLTQTTQLDPRDSVRITMDGRAVVLQGRVVDDDERRLVQNMILLTPGVYQVRNELTVATAAR